nr:zinc finger BED domain-containing protein DAYSLEEPER-like [Ipomoea batatas]
MTTSCENARIEETSDEMIDEFVEYCNQDDLDNGKSALDVYLDEPQKDMKMFGDMDILNFWKENRHRFVSRICIALGYKAKLEWQEIQVREANMTLLSLEDMISLEIPHTPVEGDAGPSSPPPPTTSSFPPVPSHYITVTG